MLQSHLSSFITQKNEILDQEIEDSERNVLQKQLGEMENEVKEIQMELQSMRHHRLDSQERLVDTIEDLSKDLSPQMSTNESMEHDIVYNEIQRMRLSYEDRKISDVNPEPFLGFHNEMLKVNFDEERLERKKYDDKLKTLEDNFMALCNPDLSDPKKDPDDQDYTRRKLRDLNEELEEMKMILNEKSEELQEYRMKYLQSAQQVEELRRQLESVELDNKQVSDQIHLEIQKMKVHFQEKLQELSPLPELLKGSQMQLQEAKELQKLAEESQKELSNELFSTKEKLVLLANSFNQEKILSSKLAEENKLVKIAIDEKNKYIMDLEKELTEFKSKALRQDEKLTKQEELFKEKTSECCKLLKELHELKDESSRSLARSKERGDMMRRFLQSQISDLERQMVQRKAQCKTYQKERDEVRQRMLFQLNTLQENFEMAEIKLRNLQSQVLTLKNSYGSILADQCGDNNLEYQ